MSSQKLVLNHPHNPVQQPVNQQQYTSQAPPAVSTTVSSALPGMAVKQQQGANVEQQQLAGKGTTGTKYGVVKPNKMQESQILQAPLRLLEQVMCGLRTQ